MEIHAKGQRRFFDATALFEKSHEETVHAWVSIREHDLFRYGAIAIFLFRPFRPIQPRANQPKISPGQRPNLGSGLRKNFGGALNTNTPHRFSGLLLSQQATLGVLLRLAIYQSLRLQPSPHRGLRNAESTTNGLIGGAGPAQFYSG